MKKIELLNKAKEEQEKLSHPYLLTEHIMLAILNDTKEKKTKAVTNAYRIEYSRMKERIIKSITFKELFTNCENSFSTSLSDELPEKHESMGLIYILLVITAKRSLSYKIIKGMLDEDGLSEERLKKDIYLFIKGYMNEKEQKEQTKMFDEPNTEEKDKAEKISFEMGKEDPYIYGRDKELELIEKTLIQLKKPNVILVGQAGVGKTALIEKLAYNIRTGKCSELLKDYKIYEISTNSLIAGTQYRGQFEERIEELIRMYRNTKTILFIDEFHTSVNLGESTEGTESLGNILKPYLARGELKVIGATTYEEFSSIANDSAYNRRFRKVEIEEPTISQMKVIMKNSLEPYIKHYGIKITKKQAEEIVEKSKKLKACNPDKSFTILELAMSNAKYENKNEITSEDIEYAIKNY